MSPLAPFGSQRGEIASYDLALAMRRAEQRKAAMAQRQAAARARRAARIAAFKRRLGLA